MVAKQGGDSVPDFFTSMVEQLLGQFKEEPLVCHIKWWLFPWD